MSEDKSQYQRNSMIFYRSFYESIQEIPKKNRLELYDAIFKYSFDFEEIHLTGISLAIWINIKPQLDANRKKWLNGTKGAEFGHLGGRPETPKEPQANPKLTPNENNNVECKLKNENKELKIKNKNLKIDDCKTILSEYDGFSTEEKDSLNKWIDHKYLIRNEKYVNAGWRAILQECLNQSQNDRDICHVIHKSMTSGSDGIGWQGIRFDLIDFRKKAVTQPLIEQSVQQEVVSDEVIAERKKILLAKIREGKKPKEISDDDWSISSCLQEAVENLIKDKLDE